MASRKKKDGFRCSNEGCGFESKDTRDFRALNHKLYCKKCYDKLKPKKKPKKKKAMVKKKEVSTGVEKKEEKEKKTLFDDWDE